MPLADRLTSLMEERGVTQSALAREVGVTQQTIGKLSRGEARSSVHLHRIAKALGTTVEYLTGETDDPKGGSSPVVRTRSDDEQPTVEVAELDLAYGMGGTYLEDLPVKAEAMRFTREWLRNFTSAPPENLFFARGAGDSMSPTILDSDIVLIDRSQDTPRMGDQIWALSFGGVGMIKRLRPHPDGTVRILSDNPQVPEDRAADGELFIIGRVVAVVRKI